MDRVAIRYEADAFSFKYKVMGRQSAGIGFLRALADARLQKVWCQCRWPDGADECRTSLTELGAVSTEVAWAPLLNPAPLAEAGVLYRADPVIEPDAWRRLARATPRAYSLCGVTHTIATHGMIETICRLLTSPLESWDAIICTSTVVRDSVRGILEEQADYLRERMGASRLSLPQLPMIPLGVHTRDFAINDAVRGEGRRQLGIGEDETVVLFVGRLSFHGKAHHLPMYLALEECAATSKVTLVQAGLFANEAIERVYKEEAKRICPSVRCLFVNGKNDGQMKNAWAAADIFTSLSDNFQESFGLTPVEAMAAGLPVVVSDWDGYKDTVRDGVDGFRIQTLALPPGSGATLADRYDADIDNYDRFAGHTSQFVAVDVDATASAFSKLINDPALRRKMGDAGRRRAVTEFDWAVVFERYRSLWGELNERRRADPALVSPARRRRRPDRPDPFTMFRSYPTSVVSDRTNIKRRSGVTLEDALARRELESIRFAAQVLPSPRVIEQAFGAVSDTEWRDFETLGTTLGIPKPDLERATVWLAKVGVFTCVPSGRSTG